LTCGKLCFFCGKLCGKPVENFLAVVENSKKPPKNTDLENLFHKFSTDDRAFNSLPERHFDLFSTFSTVSLAKVYSIILALKPLINHGFDAH
jgi:hypothetical protein